MKPEARGTALILIALAALFSACNRPTGPGVKPEVRPGSQIASSVPPDQKSIEDLRAAGSDLAKPHPVSFYLYVPSERAAKDAAKVLQERDFNTVVKEEARGKNWLCLGQKTMVPTPENLTPVSQLFESLAAQYHGKYGGWKAPVEP